MWHMCAPGCALACTPCFGQGRRRLLLRGWTVGALTSQRRRRNSVGIRTSSQRRPRESGTDPIRCPRPVLLTQRLPCSDSGK
eukprot:scaffold3368_cov107-Isochrysis_galbana.AAC.6